MAPRGFPFFRKGGADPPDSTSSADSASTTLFTRSQLSNPSASTLSPPDSIPYSGRISPSAAHAVGWGKVVADGGYLSVHTLGTLNGQRLGVDTEVTRTDHAQRLHDLRALMNAEPEPLDFYIVPSEDAHQSECVAADSKRHEFISGFTGSRGTAVISSTEALLFVDARYYVQAASQVNEKLWQVRRVGIPGLGGRDWVQWLSDRPRGTIVGVDSRLIAHETATPLTIALLGNGSRIKFPRLNLIDVIWKNQGRPEKPFGQIYILDERYAGEPAQRKISDLQAWIRAQRPIQPLTANSDSGRDSPSPPAKRSMSNTPTATIISSLENVSWTLNLRGTDLPFKPVFHAYLFVSLAAAVLFVDRKKVSPEVDRYLKNIGVVLREYWDVFTFLRTGGWGAGRVLIEPKTPYVISLMLSSSRYILAPSYSDGAKALKTETEIQGLRGAYLRDGAAMVRFFAWLDEKLAKNEPVSEYGASQKLTEYKGMNLEFVGLAYENISATGPNGAIPHYTPTRTAALLIDLSTPYVIDSGSHYVDGTCVTTRTLHFGSPTPEQMEVYTKVVKRHIALDSEVFPEGTTGMQLHVLTYKALRNDDTLRMHSSGHDNGSFLSVHEGTRGSSNGVPLHFGHVVTDEPGFYIDGRWGVRIESARLTRRVETRGSFGGDIWLGFESLTQVPIQTRMIKSKLLTKYERKWIQNYNQNVRLALTPLLTEDKRALKWLKRESPREGFM